MASMKIQENKKTSLLRDALGLIFIFFIGN